MTDKKQTNDRQTTDKRQYKVHGHPGYKEGRRGMHPLKTLKFMAILGISRGEEECVH
jgi:hypothetical protein